MLFHVGGGSATNVIGLANDRGSASCNQVEPRALASPRTKSELKPIKLRRSLIVRRVFLFLPIGVLEENKKKNLY